MVAEISAVPFRVLDLRHLLTTSEVPDGWISAPFSRNPCTLILVARCPLNVRYFVINNVSELALLQGGISGLK